MIKFSDKEHFQQKCGAVLRPGMRETNKHFQQKCGAVLRPEMRETNKHFQQKCTAVLRPDMRENKILERFRKLAKSTNALLSPKFISRMVTVLAMAIGLLVPAALAQEKKPSAVEEEIRTFCGNIADAARDQRYILQRNELKALQADVDKKILKLNKRAAQYKEWLKKRDDFMRIANTQLVEIYKNMKPDAAASQMQDLLPEVAAAIIIKLKPRLASAILNEMDSKKAAGLTGLIAAAAKPDRVSDQAPDQAPDQAKDPS